MYASADLSLWFPINDAASAKLMLVKADCLCRAGIIDESEKHWVSTVAATYLPAADDRLEAA
jgi:hypothetical protein